MIRRVLEFYGTVGVPLVYLIGLYLISLGGGLGVELTGRILGLVVALIGMGLWFISYIYLGKSFGVLPRKQLRVARGIYRYLRHPMYLGILLTYLGLSVANQSIMGFRFTEFILLPLLGLRSWFEEKYLGTS